MERTGFIFGVALLVVISFFTSCLCGSSVSELTIDMSALLAFKDHIILDPYNVLAANWTTNSSVCNWIGVSCDVNNKRVTALDLHDMGLSGTIAPHLGNLTSLSSLDISYNSFEGSIPGELAHLLQLKNMNLGYNFLSRKVPSWLGNLKQLQSLLLNDNDFTGTIPPSLRNISSLETLNMKNNSLEGNIPLKLANSSALKLLDLKFNKLTGKLPLGIFNISTLQEVDLTANSLSGRIPEDLCNPSSKLSGLFLSSNQFEGQIPSQIYQCRKLQRLSISYNHFNGSMPREIGELPMLQQLYIGGNNFIGGIPSEIGNLTQLEILSVQSGSLTGEIPPFIFNLSSLTAIDLSNNSLSGALPGGLFRNVPLLEKLYLQSNQLTGQIPEDLLGSKQLQILSLFKNHLTGSISKRFGNLTLLKVLSLGDNNLTGQLPSELGNLDLETIALSRNSFSGFIPPEIFNISTLKIISLSENRFSGYLPPNMGNLLPNLENLNLGSNRLQGSIPNSISNASMLSLLSLTTNSFNGPIPDLGNLRQLKMLLLGENNLTRESFTMELRFISYLTKCRQLEYVEVSLNDLNGILPASVGNLSTSLQSFRAFGCKIRGSIPSEFGNLSSLQSIYLDSNELNGTIPETLGKLKYLARLYLEYNRLHGYIPSSLCQLQNLGDIYVSHNMLYGPIPSCLGGLTSLRRIYLDSNKLNSTVPSTLWNLKDLVGLNLSTNYLSGSLPSTVKNLMVITELDLSQNQFSSDIPSSIGSMQSLVSLSLASNKFQSSIPESLGNLISLELLDLSHNNLSGVIPKSLEALRYLKYFNVSFNRLEGEIPTGGRFANFTAESFMQNSALCGGAKLQFPPCQSRKISKRSKTISSMMKYILPPILTATFAIAIILCMKRRRQEIVLPDDEVPSSVAWRNISYQQLLQATDSFNDINLLGAGSFGKVFRGTLSNGSIVAVKVFNLQSEGSMKSFDAECEVLCSIRHRNLIKIISCCSNKDFKALILEYMSNGSLDKWLYSHDRHIDLRQRLNIALDVASALHYLHHGNITPIVHCDLKPSNVLLDDDMTAHVGDFGLAKLFGERELMVQTNTLATIGYMAPEYGTQGIVSTSGDVYSYGIILLEIFTGKRPTDEIFGEDKDLKHWVGESLRNNSVIEVVDNKLIGGEDEDQSVKEQCLSSVFSLAMDCLANSPEDRISMNDIVAKLENIKTSFLADSEKAIKKGEFSTEVKKV